MYKGWNHMTANIHSNTLDPQFISHYVFFERALFWNWKSARCANNAESSIGRCSNWMKKFTCSHESHAPVDAFSETVTQQSFGDVSLVEKNRTNEIGVVDRFQDNFHFTLQQARFNEISCLIGIINRNTVVWFTFRIQFESGTLYNNTHL